VFCSFLFVLISNVLNLNTMEQQDSDYSDVSDVDEEYKTSSKKKGGRGYRIRNALKVPRATTYTAQALYGEYTVSLSSTLHQTDFLRSDTQF